MRNKLCRPKKRPVNNTMSTKEQSGTPSQEETLEGSSVDLMEGVSTGESAGMDGSESVSQVSHVAAVEEPAAKVVKVSDGGAGAECCKPTELSSNKENQVMVVNPGPKPWQRKQAAAWKKILEEQRVKDKEWEERMAREHGVELSDIGKPSAGEKEKPPRGGWEVDSQVVNRNSTVAKFKNCTEYRPYQSGDLVLDFSCNAKCRAFFDQSKSRNLPTLTLPLLSGVQNCCPFDMMTAGLPSFPVNLPPLDGIKFVVCFDVLAANPKDHAHQWRIMDQLTHKQSVNWARCSRRMNSKERTTALVLKDFNNKVLCKFVTFCRVEEGKRH